MSRAALITGVGRRRGIGAGIAAGLAADGWDLALSFWRPYDERLHMESDPDDPDQMATELRMLGGKIELLSANLEEPELGMSADELDIAMPPHLGVQLR